MANPLGFNKIEANPLNGQSQQLDNSNNQEIRCLLAEDNKLNQFVMAKMLGSFGINVEFASNGELALTKLKSGTYHFAIFDSEMPVKTGPDAVKEWREQEIGDKMPIVSWTTKNDSDSIKLCRESGMDISLEKPCSKAKLRVALIALGIISKKDS